MSEAPTNPGSTAPRPTGTTADTAASTARSREETAGQLIGDISSDLSTLMRQEMQLAKAELRQEATKTGQSVGMLGGSGFAGYMTLLFLSIACWAWLDNVMDSGWAAFIVTVVWGIAAAVLFVVGRKRMRQVHPVPERSVEAAKRTPAALKPDSRR